MILRACLAEQGPNDVPVLNKIQQVALRLLEDASTAKGKGKAIETDHPKEQEIRIGFIVSPFSGSLAVFTMHVRPIH